MKEEFKVNLSYLRPLVINHAAAAQRWKAGKAGNAYNPNTRETDTGWEYNVMLSLGFLRPCLTKQNHGQIFLDENL